MNEHPHDDQPRGIFDSLRALLDTILAILHHRAELVTTELEEELTRLIGVLLWALVAVFSAIIGATFVAYMVLFAMPEKYRALTAAGLGLVFLVVAVTGYLSIRKILRAKPRPFDATLRELEKDRKALRRGR
jgi:uncharacterized membrane protein YqjE